MFGNKTFVISCFRNNWILLILFYIRFKEAVKSANWNQDSVFEARSQWVPSKIHSAHPTYMCGLSIVLGFGRFVNLCYWAVSNRETSPSGGFLLDVNNDLFIRLIILLALVLETFLRPSGCDKKLWSSQSWLIDDQQRKFVEPSSSILSILQTRMLLLQKRAANLPQRILFLRTHFLLLIHFLMK